jgi:ribosomal protein S18 acetylase RimI-like enzyme
MPGVLESDTLACQLYPARGYRESRRVAILRRELADFEPPIDRRQMEARRRLIVTVTPDPLPRTWWEASVWGPFDLTRFELLPRGGGRPLAWALFRNLEITAVSGAGRAAGLIELVVEEPYRRRGLAVFLLSEICRQFGRQGMALLEMQVQHDNQPALGMARKLGFRQVAEGIVFHKDFPQ